MDRMNSSGSKVEPQLTDEEVRTLLEILEAAELRQKINASEIDSLRAKVEEGYPKCKSFLLEQ